MAELPLEKLKGMVSTSADLTSHARGQSERDRDYRDHHQWTREEISILNQRKQPIVVSNHVARKVDAMLGIETQSRVDPKAHPRTPRDEQSADMATKALVFVDDNTRFDAKRTEAFENLVVEGYGGVEVIVEEKRGRPEIGINRLRWEEIFFDPYSREKDFSDAAYMGTQKWMTLDAALELYSPVYQGEEPLEQVLETHLTASQDGETYEDRPQHANGFRWMDRKARRVRVAQMYYKRGGTWYLAIFCGGATIFNEESPYLDDDGKPDNAMILMSAYVDRENNRYGVVRSMISQQDEINKRRSKYLHLLSSRQTVGVKGAVNSVEAMKRELDDPRGHVELNLEAFEDAARAGVKPFEIIGTTDLSVGQAGLLQEAKDEIDQMGPNPSLIGQTQGGASGRAIMAQQQAGMAQLGPVYEVLRDWTLRVYRVVWARIKQFWTEERWVRVTDEAGAVEFVGLNVPQGYVEVVDMQSGQPTLQPQIENKVADMDVDIVMDATPEYATLRHEQFEKLADLMAKGAPIPPEMLIEASSFPDKAKFLQTMKERGAEQQQIQQQLQAMQQQIEQMKAQAEIESKQASAAKDAASAQKIMAEVAETQADTEKTMVETQRLALGY